MPNGDLTRTDLEALKRMPYEWYEKHWDQPQKEAWRESQRFQKAVEQINAESGDE